MGNVLCAWRRAASNAPKHSEMTASVLLLVDFQSAARDALVVGEGGDDGFSSLLK